MKTPSQFLVFWLVICLLTAGCGNAMSTPPSAPLPSRNLVSSTINMTEIWRVRTGPPNYPSPAAQTPPFLYVAKDKIMINAFIMDGSNDSYLTAYALDTGAVIWQTRYSEPRNGTSMGAGYLDTVSNRLYLEYGFHVGIFDIGTGQQLWVTEELRGHESYVFPYQQANPAQLQIDNSQERITIDPSTGNILSVQPSNLAAMDFMRVPHNNILIKNISYDEQAKFNLAPETYHFGAFDANGQLLWEIPNSAEFWPTFINDDDFIVAFGGPKYWLWRVNAQTGLDRWRSDLGIVSNYAILRDCVIALREDGNALLSMDLETGRLSGYAIFDRGFTEAIGESPFWVAASDPYLFVYFGDTQELIAFKVSPP
ncbi:MAG: PQQ-like beta-propeller repeat protein [Chloroflexi bacterium]|nr:PQQ-like beta-propeller repeat protein [Chloroflexota bacterium]